MKKETIPFQLVGNDLALDFVNTRIAVSGQRVDLTDTPDRFLDWLGEALPECPVGSLGTKDFTALMELREALHSVLLSVVEDGPAPDDALSVVNRHLKDHGPRLRLVQNPHGFEIEEKSVPDSISALMAFLASTGAALLAKTDRKRIRACANPDCVLIFRDTSKSGRRRWCSMQTCGNRAKVANFRAGA